MVMVQCYVLFVHFHFPTSFISRVQGHLAALFCCRWRNTSFWPRPSSRCSTPLMPRLSCFWFGLIWLSLLLSKNKTHFLILKNSAFSGSSFARNLAISSSTRTKGPWKQTGGGISFRMLCAASQLCKLKIYNFFHKKNLRAWDTRPLRPGASQAWGSGAVWMGSSEKGPAWQRSRQRRQFRPVRSSGLAPGSN